MRALKLRTCAMVIAALVVGGCSSSSGDNTIASLSSQVATLNSRLDEVKVANAAAQRERDAAQAASDALQSQLDARARAEAQAEAASTTTATRPPEARCATDVLLPVVASLFPDNDRWNIVDVQIQACVGGYVRLFAIADQSVCPSDTPQCLENEQVFLHDVEGTWTFLDSGTGLSCDDPQFMSLPIVPACKALVST